MADPVRDFAQTTNGEWAIANGDFGVVAGAAAIPQGIQIGLGMQLGECDLDESIGVDYVGSILIKNPDPLVVRALLSEAISQTPDVTNVIGADLVEDGKTRQASISYEVDTVYESAPISSLIAVP